MAIKSGPSLSNPFGFVAEQWKMLWSVVAIVMGIIGSFWVDQPYVPGSDQVAKNSDFAKFVVAIIIGLMFPLMMKKSNRQIYALFWRKIAAAGFILSIVAFFGYQCLYEEWVVTPTINNKKLVLVTGSEIVDTDVKMFITQYSMQYKKKVSDWELLQNAAWIPWRIWTKESILKRRRILSVLYVLVTPFFAITMVAIAQVISCTMSKQ